MQTGHDFALYPWRFEFTARETVRFPAGGAGNVLRGGFGTIFRQLVCSPECEDTRVCEKRTFCSYARIFEAATDGPRASGFADPPRPFVLRCAHLDGTSFATGERFHLDVHMFDVRKPSLADFAASLVRLGDEGLGPGRGRVELRQVLQLSAPPIAIADAENLPPPLLLSLEPGAEVREAEIEFVTPTELKPACRVAAPEFHVLFARIRDRISTLRALYGGGPLAVDFRGSGERAARVNLVDSDLHRTDAKRRSSRTGQVHPLGGFTGSARYAGDLTEFIPYLEAAQWTGVGRQTVWGKGEVKIRSAK